MTSPHIGQGAPVDDSWYARAVRDLQRQIDELRASAVGPGSSSNVVTGTGDPSSVSIAYTLPGVGDSDASGAHAVAVGPFTQALGDASFVGGYGSTANEHADIAIGYGATTATSTGGNNIAIGNSATTYDTEGVAIGFDAIVGAGAGAALAVGENSRASDLYTTAVGGVSAHATAESSMALGSYTEASAAGAFAIGTDSSDNGAAASTMDDGVLGTVNHTIRIPGKLRVDRALQTTVGAAGAASALPVLPSAYIPIVASDGTEYVLPVYAKV